MKKKSLIIISVLFLSFLITAYVAAEGLLSIQQNIIQVQTDIKGCEYEEYVKKTAESEERIQNLEEQIEQAMRDKETAQNQNDPLGVLRAEAVISNCTEQLKESRRVLSEYILQKDLSFYYVENREGILAKEQAEAEYSLYRSQLEISLYDCQIAYLNDLEAQMQEKLRIEEAKSWRGYSTTFLIQEAETALVQVTSQMETVKARQEFLQEEFRLKGGVVTDVSMGDEIGELREDYLEQFRGNSIQLKYLDNQIQAYTTYLNSMNEADDNYKKAQLQLELAVLNKQQYETDLELYVKEKTLRYKEAKQNVVSTEAEIELQKQKIHDSELLYEKGKITQMMLIELNTELKKLEYERMSFLYEADAAVYVLNHGIEGQ